MANKIKHKTTAVAGRVPATTDLVEGEILINSRDGRMFIKKNDGTTQSIVIFDPASYMPKSGGTVNSNLAVNSLSLAGLLQINTSSAPSGQSRGISWYNPSMTTWYDYMCSPAHNAPNGKVVTQYGDVTSWAIRHNIENVAGYGWIWEAATNNDVTNSPTPLMALSSNNGNLKIKGDFSASGASFSGSLMTPVLGISSGNEIWGRSSGKTLYINYRDYNGATTGEGANTYICDGKGNVVLRVMADKSVTINGNQVVDTTDARLTNARTANGGRADYSNYLADSGFTRIVNPVGASSVSNASSVTGAIKIKLPVATYGCSTMVRMTIKVYQYNTGKSLTFEVGGYNYQDHTWYNVFATQASDSNDTTYNVRFGHDGTSECIWIGEANTIWTYPQVYVNEVLCGHAGIDADWATGWAINFATSFGTVSQNYTPSVLWSSKNFNPANYALAHTHPYASDTHNHSGVYAPNSHSHDYSPSSHNHDGVYAPVHSHPYASDTHNHSGVYAPVHTHPYASDTHNHDTVYAPIHSHPYASSSHNHDGVYAPNSHTHDYAPSSHTHSGLTGLSGTGTQLLVANASGAISRDTSCRVYKGTTAPADTSMVWVKTAV
jgi:hypothetical protein